MENAAVPMLFPYEPGEFLLQIRKIIQEEVGQLKRQAGPEGGIMETPGLTEKPLYKIAEICQLFNVSRTTVYDWVKHGKLRRVKIRSRVYFLGNEVRGLLK